VVLRSPLVALVKRQRNGYVPLALQAVALTLLKAAFDLIAPKDVENSRSNILMREILYQPKSLA
jgi:hypothetical protein